MATSSGLTFFDGREWTRYGLSYGLPDHNVTAVELDSRGNLWVGTERGLGTFRGGQFVPTAELDGIRIQRIVADSARRAWLMAAKGPGTTNVARLRDGRWSWVELDAPIDDLMVSDTRVFALRGERLFEFVDDRLTPLPDPAPLVLLPGRTWVATMPAERNSVRPPSLVVATPSRVAQQRNDREWQQLPMQDGLEGGPVLALRSGEIVGARPDGGSVWRVDGGIHFPCSTFNPKVQGIVRGLAEGKDGSLWGYGEGCLVHFRATIESAEPVLPIEFANAAGVWGTDGQSVHSLDQNGYRRRPEVRRLLAQSSRGEILACGEGPRRLLLLAPTRDPPREHPTPFDTDRVVAAGFNHAGKAWLMLADDALAFATVDEHGATAPIAAPALRGLSPANLQLTAAGPKGIWLCGEDRAGVRRVVRLDELGGEEITTPEPLPTWPPQGLPDGRLAIIGTGGVWVRQVDGRWDRLTDDFLARSRWLATVGNRLLIGCDTTSRHHSGLATFDGHRTQFLLLPRPELVGADAQRVLLSSNQELFCVDQSGLPMLVRTAPIPPGARIIADSERRLWMSSAGRGRLIEGPTEPPRCRVEPRTSNPMEDRRIVFAVQGNYAWMAWSEADQRQFTYRWRVVEADSQDGWSPPSLATEPFELHLPAGVHDIEVVVADGLGRESDTVSVQVDVAPMPLQLRPWFPWLVGAIVATLLGLASHAFIARRRLSLQALRLRLAVDKRTRRLRTELVRRIKVERHLRHQQRVLALLATGEPIASALEALVIGFEERLVGWRGVALLHQGESLRMVAAPNLTDAQRARLLECKLTDKTSACVRAFTEGRHVIASGAEWSHDGTSTTGTLCAQPIVSGQSEPLGVLAVLHDDDVTPTREQIGFVEAAAHIAALAIESKRGETERQRMQQEMLDAQKLRSLGLLAGGIAHDFNNLLTGILGNAGLARMFAVAGSPSDDALAQVELATNRAADLCAQLLAYSGRGRFTVKPLDLSAVVREMTQMLRLSISRRVSLDLRLDPHLPAVEADATQTRQVLMNLISNAAEAIGDRDGLLVVTTGTCVLSEADLRHCVVKPPVQPGSYVYVRVTDNGCGMTESVRRSMFDPFFTTKATGRGLGLAAVLGIVHGHRGAIEIESEVGRGTSISVFLPASDKRAEPDQLANISLPAPRGSGRALVVEDEMLVRDLARSLLESIGFEVTAVADGEQALAEFATHGDALQLVLLDIVLPRLDGREVLRRMRERRARLPVILSSGNDVDDGVADPPRDPYTWFLKKPYGPQGLIAALREALTSPR